MLWVKIQACLNPSISPLFAAVIRCQLASLLLLFPQGCVVHSASFLPVVRARSKLEASERARARASERERERKEKANRATVCYCIEAPDLVLTCHDLWRVPHGSSQAGSRRERERKTQKWFRKELYYCCMYPAVFRQLAHFASSPFRGIIKLNHSFWYETHLSVALSVVL